MSGPTASAETTVGALAAPRLESGGFVEKRDFLRNWTTYIQRLGGAAPAQRFPRCIDVTVLQLLLSQAGELGEVEELIIEHGDDNWFIDIVKKSIAASNVEDAQRRIKEVIFPEIDMYKKPRMDVIECTNIFTTEFVQSLKDCGNVANEIPVNEIMDIFIKKFPNEYLTSEANRWKVSEEGKKALSDTGLAQDKVLRLLYTHLYKKLKALSDVSISVMRAGLVPGYRMEWMERPPRASDFGQEQPSSHQSANRQRTQQRGESSVQSRQQGEGGGTNVKSSGKRTNDQRDDPPQSQGNPDSKKRKGDRLYCYKCRSSDHNPWDEVCPHWKPDPPEKKQKGVDRDQGGGGGGHDDDQQPPPAGSHGRQGGNYGSGSGKGGQSDNRSGRRDNQTPGYSTMATSSNSGGQRRSTVTPMEVDQHTSAVEPSLDVRNEFMCENAQFAPHDLNPQEPTSFAQEDLGDELGSWGRLTDDDELAASIMAKVEPSPTVWDPVSRMYWSRENYQKILRNHRWREENEEKREHERIERERALQPPKPVSVHRNQLSDEARKEGWGKMAKFVEPVGNWEASTEPVAVRSGDTSQAESSYAPAKEGVVGKDPQKSWPREGVGGDGRKRKYNAFSDRNPILMRGGEERERAALPPSFDYSEGSLKAYGKDRVYGGPPRGVAAGDGSVSYQAALELGKGAKGSTAKNLIVHCFEIEPVDWMQASIVETFCVNVNKAICLPGGDTVMSHTVAMTLMSDKSVVYPVSDKMVADAVESVFASEFVEGEVDAARSADTMTKPLQMPDPEQTSAVSNLTTKKSSWTIPGVLANADFVHACGWKGYGMHNVDLLLDDCASANVLHPDMAKRLGFDFDQETWSFMDLESVTGAREHVSTVPPIRLGIKTVLEHRDILGYRLTIALCFPRPGPDNDMMIPSRADWFQLEAYTSLALSSCPYDLIVGRDDMQKYNLATQVLYPMLWSFLHDTDEAMGISTEEEISLGESPADTKVFFRSGHLVDNATVLATSMNMDEDKGVDALMTAINRDFPYFNELLELLHKHPQLFDEDLKTSGLKGYWMSLDLVPGEMLQRHKPRRYSPAMWQEIEAEVQRLIDCGVLEESDSEYTNPFVMSKKPDGTYRMCTDLTKVNEVTRSVRYPLPLMDQVLSLLAGMCFFASLDMKQSYYQLRLHPSVRKWTAIATRNGTWQFTRVPFGCKNAPNIFQKIMREILKGMDMKTCVVFIDDIIIFARTAMDFLTNLEAVMTRLEEYNVRLRLSKCKFGYAEVDYLGFHVDGKGFRIKEKRVASIRNYPVPGNVKELRSFLGMIASLHSFMDHAYTALSMLFELTKPKVKWEWTSSHSEAFELVRDAVC